MIRSQKPRVMLLVDNVMQHKMKKEIAFGTIQ
jgi:hypothetical protein